MPRKSKITIQRLTREQVTPEIVDEINTLLRKQHSRAMSLDSSLLRAYVQRAKVIVAVQNEQIIGMGVLVSIECLTHWYGRIHNLVIADGQDVITLGKRLVEALAKKEEPYPEYIESCSWVQDPRMLDIFKELGFTEKPYSRFRLRLKKYLVGNKSGRI